MGFRLAWVAAAVPFLLLGTQNRPLPTADWPDRYDEQFRKYSKRYFGPGFDWRWFKAQGIAESGLRPDAVSPAGARGVMQILPSTFEELRKTNGVFYSIDDPRWNIAAGIYYDRKLYERWAQRLGPAQHLPFTFASYNAGFKGIQRARDRAGRAGQVTDRWSAVRRYSPRQTRYYVARIHRLMGREETGDVVAD